MKTHFLINHGPRGTLKVLCDGASPNANRDILVGYTTQAHIVDCRECKKLIQVQECAVKSISYNPWPRIRSLALFIGAMLIYFTIKTLRGH